ncbi:MAG: porin [Thermoguttaceae bacterium]
MKQLLLGTTTLIGAAGLFAGAALADTPKVTVGGYANFEAAYQNDDLNGKNASGVYSAPYQDQRPQAFRSDTQVDFKIDGKSEAGLGYGGEIDLLADTSPDVQGRGFNAAKTFVYTDGNWGRFELGSNVGADGTLKVDAGTIARATGGIDGDWSYFANANDQFLAMSSLPLAYGATNSTTTYDGIPINAGYIVNNLGNHTEENINKITYYTPRWQGLQVGVSYLPDQTNTGQGALGFKGPDRLDNNAGLAQNIFAGGINYDNKWGEFGLGVAATGEYGNAQKPLTSAGVATATNTYEDLKAWEAGGKLSYMGFSLAGSYGDWGRSLTEKASNSKKNYFWDLGAAYEYGPFGVSLTYLNSQVDCGYGVNTTTGAQGTPNGTTITRGAGINGSCLNSDVNGSKNKFDSISTGVDYKLAPGLTPYAEVTWYNEKVGTQVAANPDNKGYVAIIGTQLNF